MNEYDNITTDIAIKNEEMLRRARKILNDEQFFKVYKSYKQLFRFQIAMLIGYGIFTALMGIIFYKEAGFVILGCLSMFPIVLPIWLILSQFVSGRLWHKYLKWYKKKRPVEELYQLLEKY